MRLCVWFALLVLGAAGCGGGGGGSEQSEAASCEDSFLPEAQEEAGIEGTIRACETATAWRAAAARHPDALGGFSADEMLAMTCAVHEGEDEFRAFCSAPELRPAPVKGGTYVGRTSQKKSITLNVSPNGKTLRYKFWIRCPIGTVKLSLELDSEPFRIRQDGTFGEKTQRGEFVSRDLAKGTFHLRFPTDLGRCNTGVVNWEARLR